jgi:hypothetical protein
MAQIIKPKRRHTSGAPTTSHLAEGEIAVNTSDYSIYVRDDANNILKVGGVQTPMNQDLDTNDFEIKNEADPVITGFPNSVNLGSLLKLDRYAIMPSMIIDADQLEVGKRYQIKTVGDTDWAAMGAGAGFVNNIFTCTATGSGTGNVAVGDEYFGLLAYNTGSRRLVMYNEYDSSTSGTDLRFGWSEFEDRRAE